MAMIGSAVFTQNLHRGLEMRCSIIEPMTLARGNLFFLQLEANALGSIHQFEILIASSNRALDRD